MERNPTGLVFTAKTQVNVLTRESRFYVLHYNSKFDRNYRQEKIAVFFDSQAARKVVTSKTIKSKLV